MAVKTAAGLVEYAAAQLGLPYWYGTYGREGTEALYLAKKKQYPKYYSASDFPSQYGKRVHDCVGLVKGYLWSDTPKSNPRYTRAQDVSANGMLNSCKVKGKIATLPEVPGTLVFKSGHVGVYIGNGGVIEAKGHAYGVIKSRLSATRWVNWGYCPWIDYGAAQTATTETPASGAWVVTRELLRGVYGADVWELKTRLFTGGYYDKRITKIASKGFGSDTVKAVKNFQTAKGLTVDGVAGKQTITALGGKYEA